MTSFARSRMVLPADVVITPVAEVPPELRVRFAHAEGDFCVTRPRSRTTTCVVDGLTVELLEHFRDPTSIVDAVLELSLSSDRGAQALLDEAFPALLALAAEGLLLPEGSVRAEAVRPEWSPGDRIAGLEILRCVRVLDDTEVYLGRDDGGEFVAVKRRGRASGPGALLALQHEVNVLHRLAGRAGPALRRVEDEGDGAPILVLDWVRGVDVETAGADLLSPGRRSELFDLGDALLDAYKKLHLCGVLHGDVHPRNVMAGPANEVTILDFGASCLLNSGSAPVRGGIDTYQAPEIAHARQQTGMLPEPSVASELYALGALLFLLVTGGPTHLFSLQPAEMLRQVMTEQQLPFEHYGLNSPAVESCLARALDKNPAGRYGSVAEFSRVFHQAASTDLSAAPPDVVRGSDPAAGGLVRALAELSPSGVRRRSGLPAPTASIAHGAAGLAYALLRIAHVLDRPDVLAGADSWSTSAVSAAEEEQAFRDDSRGIGPALFGTGSLFHHACGVHLVHALVAHARGDLTTCRRETDAFVRTARPDAALDVAFGRAGLLMGYTALVEALGPEEALIVAGTEVGVGLWAALADQPAMATGRGLTTLGASHGWAGMMTALLRWSAVVCVRPPDGLVGRLHELAELARPTGRGLVWPRKSDGGPDNPVLAASWCNGSAGYVALWTTAARLLGEDRYDELAEAAAWHAYEGSGAAPGGLCCGLTGRGLALLTLHRHTGDPSWLTRARLLGERAAESARAEFVDGDRIGLFHGPVGPALLAAELAVPDGPALTVVGAW